MDLLRNSGLLRAFLAVATEQNVTGAAEKLGISQPALTRNIRKLEDECRAQLFDRHTRGVSLTVYGEALLRYARQIETECRFATSEIEALQHGHRGHLRIGAGPFWGGTLLPRALNKLHHRFPDVRVTLDVGVNNIIHPKLFAVVSASPHDVLSLPDRIKFDPIAKIESKIFARADHPIFQKGDLSSSDLSRYQWVLYQADIDAVGRLSAVLKKFGSGPPRISVESSSLMAVVELIRTGDLLACLAAPLFGSARDIGIRQVPFPLQIWSFDAGILYHGAVTSSAPFIVLRQTLTDLVDDLGLGVTTRRKKDNGTILPR
jgi:DNA-binding transcriptional LysR family regulator